MCNPYIIEKLHYGDNEFMNFPLAWAKRCLISKTGICFITVSNFHNGQRSNSKLSSHKHLLCNKQHDENATSPFSVFLLLQQKRDFCQKFNWKAFNFSRWIFQGLSKFYYLTKFCDLPILDSKMTVQYFSKFPIFLLTIWKLKVNFSNFSREPYYML